MANFETIKKPKITCDSLLSIKQGPRESTRMYVNIFVESAYRVSDIDDNIAVLALRKGLIKGTLALRHVSTPLPPYGSS
jgi:F0F1-type ATP synthase epsilon subunit